VSKCSLAFGNGCLHPTPRTQRARCQGELTRAGLIEAYWNGGERAQSIYTMIYRLVRFHIFSRVTMFLQQVSGAQSEQLDGRVTMVAVRSASGHGKMGDRLAGHFVLAEMGIEQ